MNETTASPSSAGDHQERFIPYPRAMAMLKSRFNATPAEVAAWFFLGPDQGGFFAYLNANEITYGANDDLLAVMQDIAGEWDEVNNRRLGRWINRHAGRIVNGRRFMKGSGSSSSVQWRVESVSSVCEVSIPPIEKSVTAEAYRRASNGE